MREKQIYCLYKFWSCVVKPLKVQIELGNGNGSTIIFDRKKQLSTADKYHFYRIWFYYKVVLLRLCLYNIFTSQYSSVQMVEPFQDQTPHFFGSDQIIWADLSCKISETK